MRTNNKKLAIHGIWTPKAKILCPMCHGRVFPNVKYNRETNKFEDLVKTDEEFEKLCTPEPLYDTNNLTTCDKCGKEIQISDNTAHENNLCKILKEYNINAHMAQTGGMNSAIEIQTKDDGFILITYDVTGEDEWLLGFYDKDGEFLDEYYMTNEEDDMIEYILALDCLI